jgi:hypothetical protein
MQHFNRTDVQAPASLTDERSSRARKALMDIFATDSARLEQERVRMAHFAVEDDELLEALGKLFRGRCAFCESENAVTPYRFRPPEEAGPTSSVAPEYARLSHLYYTWLVNDWANIYAICDGCRPLEASVFPIRTGKRMPLPHPSQVEQYASNPSGLWPFPGSERQVFLDPCGDENFRLNLAALPDGRIMGLSERGDWTVRHFRLDRDDLTSRRRRAFDDYLSELVQMADPGYPAGGPFRFLDMEYGGAWYLLLYQLARRIGSAFSTFPRLTPSKIRDYYAQGIVTAVNFRKQLDEALRSLNVSPQLLRRPTRRPRVIMRGKARPVTFEIENFKSIDHLRLILLPHGEAPPQKVGVTLAAGEIAKREGSDRGAPALMILGENAVGKSSILEAIAFLLAGKDARSDLDVPSASLMLDPGLLGGSGKLRPAKLGAEFDDGSRVTFEVSKGDGDDEDNERRTPVFAYGAFRIFTDGIVGQRPSSPVISLFRPERLLPNPEKWLVSISEKPLFAEVRRALNRILAIDDDYDGITIQENKCLLITSGVADDGSRIETRTPLNLVSSGFRSVLSMACHVLRGLAEAQDASSASLANARAVVLIDEVEAHLHPRWKMRVVQGLREALPGVTFVMTTHDPLCLRGLSSSELVVLRRAYRRGDDAGLPSAVEQLEDLPPVSALTMEQLLTSDFFDLFSTDEADTELTLARAGDLLASGPRDKGDAWELSDLRRSIGDQVARALPIGSTEIERLVQEAVEDFLRKRAIAPAGERRRLRDSTRAKIVDLLGRY